MKCDACQRNANIQHLLALPITPIYAPRPFMQWGMDILDSFPLAPRQHKFLIVVVDYFTR